MARRLIKSGIVITLDDAVPALRRGDVLIEGTRIAAIAPEIAAEDAEIIDAARCIVMPGFVNAHIHAWQTGLRGVAADWTIPEYLHAMHASIAPGFRPQDIFIANLAGALNQLDAGVTTMVDWCHNNPTPAHTDAAVDGLLESGIRALFLHGSPKPDPQPGQRHFSEIPHPRAEIERLARGRIGARDGLVGLGMAILGPAYSTYEVSRQDVALARELAMICSMHVGGGAMRTPDGFQRLAAEGLIDDRVNIVHGNSLADATLRQLVENGAGVTVTPEVELQMGFGDCLTGRLRALGAAPSLGSDVESSLGSDMFTVMRIALQSQRNLDNQQAIARTGRAPERISIPCREALLWATMAGARMAGLDDRIGSLRPGKEADIVLLRADDLNLLPVVDPVASIVLHAGVANVDTVLVAGQVVKRGGKLLYRDLARRKAELAESSRRILGAARLR
ncbi:MAG TPA: amidohydrolase family protein [Stellaceae bacterium]|nr:amidohydrolase family protein [Stellaceae bacterium]